MNRNADYWINTLQLTAHIEGGAFTQTYAADIIIPQKQLPGGFNGSRPASTAIYFLLKAGQFSAMHRIASDELWHFYYGDPLIVYEIDAAGDLTEHLLGSDPDKGESFQCVIKAGNWFGSRTKDGGSYSLVCCTVSPGFDFADFALADRTALTALYPRHTALINSLTR